MALAGSHREQLKEYIRKPDVIDDSTSFPRLTASDPLCRRHGHPHAPARLFPEIAAEAERGSVR